MPNIHHPAFLNLLGNKNFVFFIVVKFGVITIVFDAAKIQQNFTKSKYKLQKVKFKKHFYFKILCFRMIKFSIFSIVNTNKNAYLCH